MNRTWPLIVSIVMLVLVALPVKENWAEKPRDDFPLSYYPMFSQVHDDTQRETYVLGITDDGERLFIPYRGYWGAGGGNQARKQLRRNARNDPAGAEKIARRGDPAFADVVEVRVVTGRWSISKYFGEGDRTPLAERVHATATVSRANGETSP